MKPWPITKPPVKHPYRSAERLAGEWNYSLATFLRRHKRYRFRTTTTGNGRGQVWYNRDDVKRHLGPPPARKFKMRPPYFRAERCAGALDMSMSAFKNWTKKLGCLPKRIGKGRGFVWFYWPNVRLLLLQAGFTNVPRMP